MNQPHKRRGSKPQPIPPEMKRDLRRMYLQEKKSTYTIGEAYEKDYVTIKAWLKRCNIPLRSKAEAHKVRGEIVDPVQKERISQLYHDSKMSLQEVGKELGISHTAVLYKMKKYGIPRRSSRDATLLTKGKRLPKESQKVLVSKDLLGDMYTRQFMTSAEIASKLGCSYGYVRKMLVKHKIPCRQAMPKSGQIKIGLIVKALKRNTPVVSRVVIKVKGSDIHTYKLFGGNTCRM